MVLWERTVPAFVVIGQVKYNQPQQNAQNAVLNEYMMVHTVNLYNKTFVLSCPRRAGYISNYQKVSLNLQTFYGIG